MSDTDDTDELLLIPPQIDDNNIVQSYSIPYYQIVDKLITQVAKLKNRIISIENSTDNLSLGSNSFDACNNMLNSDSSNGTCRRCISYESLPNHQYSDCRRANNFVLPPCFSTQSTPQKPRSKLMLKSFPNSPKTDDDSKLFKRPTHRAGVPKAEPDKAQKHSALVENSIIKEIDDFLLNVKPANATAKTDVARTLVFNKVNNGHDDKQSKTVVDIQQILKEMEEQEEKLKGPQHDKQEVEWKRESVNLSITSSESSLTDKGTVLCRTNAEQPEEYKEKSIVVERYSSCCSQDLSTGRLDAHSSNAQCLIPSHKTLLDSSKSNNEGTNLGRVSLVNLWSGRNEDMQKNSEHCIQKLHEEKLRRSHCEELIQQLQNKILEQQEKLAVAIQVDEAKDTAIIRFHDAWEKATAKFKHILKERDQLVKDVEKLTDMNQNIKTANEERIEFHRKETNEALNMVQNHQKKLEELEEKLRKVSGENDALKSTNQLLEKKLMDEEAKNKQLSNILADKEIELDESRKILMHAKQEVAQCQSAVEMCQKDFKTIKNEYDLIQNELKNERNNVLQLHEQNKIIHEQLDNHQKKEKTLMETLKSAQEKQETNKKELRNFYQGQVELLVQTKLKEFQNQLDEAEHKMKEELEKKELEIAKSAAIHIQQINDKYSLEINLLEQKHQEEIQLKQVKMAQLDQKLHELQVKFDKQRENRSELVRQLQKVMEAQWNEALRIINSGKSPLFAQDDSSSTIDQLHSLHSKSYQDMEALLNFEYEEKRNPFNENDLNRFNVDRKNHHSQMKTCCKNKKHEKDDECLQKYVNMLLARQHDKNGNSTKLQCEQGGSAEKTTWQNSESNKHSFHENDAQEGSRKKIPWK